MQKLDTNKLDLESPTPDSVPLSYEPEIKEIDEKEDIEKKGNRQKIDPDFDVHRNPNPYEAEIPQPPVDRE